MIYSGLKIRLKNPIRGKNRKPCCTRYVHTRHDYTTQNHKQHKTEPKNNQTTPKKETPTPHTTYPQTQQRQLQEQLCHQSLWSISYRFFSASTLGDPSFMLILSKDFVPIHSTSG